MSPLALRVLEIASGEVGVREEGGMNRGPRVEQYLASVGLPPGNPWCAAFVYYVLDRAARELGMRTGCPRTGKVARMWRRASIWRSQQPAPGMVFIHLKDPGSAESKGHCGIVTDVAGTHILTIEANTNKAGSRDGDGVLRQRRRILDSDYVLGYLDFCREEVLS